MGSHATTTPNSIEHMSEAAFDREYKRLASELERLESELEELEDRAIARDGAALLDLPRQLRLVREAREKFLEYELEDRRRSNFTAAEKLVDGVPKFITIFGG